MLCSENIVLEMTEKMAVEQYDDLRRALKYYRGMGFRLPSMTPERATPTSK